MSSDDSERPENTPDEAPAEAEAGTDLATDSESPAGSQEVALSPEDSAETGVQQAIAEEELVAGQIGVQRYVHAAFFAAGILAAYLSGKIILSAWNSLADWPEAVRTLPFLIEYTEQERGSLTLVIGAVLGVVGILRYYRRPAVRDWATEVAGELARVTWPEKDIVTNGTIVVLIAGTAATLYIALLDRLWGYLTNLVYGA